jgi:ATP-binding cassette subfamily F protein 3
VQSGANVLVLDEPTNHLDLESREALEDALREFPGSLLLVSHDRALLDAVGTRTIAVEDGTLHSYEGGWPEYLRVREERKELAQAPKVDGDKKAKGPKPKPKTKPSGPSKGALKRQADLERDIERAEAELKALEDELADPSAWNDPRSAARSSARHAAAKRALDELYEKWEHVAS